MKKCFTLLCCAIIASASLSAQCVRDSSLLISGEFLSPPPYSTANPVIATVPACINEPYLMSVTFNVPETFTLGTTSLPIEKVAIATTGAVIGLPAGLSYTCDPPNCEFPKKTLGCILVSGTPTAANVPGDFEISLKVKVTSLITLDLDFPSAIAADQKYYITVKPTGQCMSGTSDQSENINSVKNAPNPFGQQTVLNVNTVEGGQFQFDVFNLVGQRVYNEAIQLVAGENQFTFDAGEMPNGTYFYTIGNKEGRVSRTFVVQR